MAISRASMNYLTHEEILHTGTTSAVLVAWLEFHILRTRRAVLNLRKKVMLLVQMIHEDPKRLTLKAILDLAENVRVAIAVAGEQAQSLNIVKNLDVDPDSDGDSVDFNGLIQPIAILVATA